MRQQEPSPEVIYLPALFRRIRNGTIRIPAFQRGYVWEKAKGLELLDSVRNGYPIGSLLFWEADVAEMTTDSSDELAFPHPDVQGTVAFVLDGMQRLSTLYGAFHSVGTEDSGDFNVFYDLMTDEFLTARDKTESSIDLRKLFVPKELLAEQARLATLANGDMLVDNTIDLLGRFQEYLVPVIRISSTETREVVAIFERINSTATRLGAVDFMRALTWHKDFDLTYELASVAERIGTSGWTIPQVTIAKAIALSLGVVPKSDEMIKLREVPPSALQDATRAVEASVLRVTKFLEQEVGVASYDFVPYEAQFVILTTLSSALSPDDAFPIWARSWFWTTGFSEWFFGKPDAIVAQIANQVRDNPANPPYVQFRLAPEIMMRRAQKKGGAVAMAMTGALAQGARSVITGQVIAKESIVSRYESARVGALFSRVELAPWYGKQPRSDKFVANCIVFAEGEERHYGDPSELRRHILLLANTEEGCLALKTQGIDANALDALRRGEPEELLVARSAELVKIAELISQQTQLG